MMSEGVKRNHNLSKFELKNNRITDQASEFVIESITKNGKYIDISGNKIGKIGCQNIAKCLYNKNTWLEELNLENNLLGD